MTTVTIPSNFTLYRGDRSSDSYKKPDPVYFLYGNDGYNITQSAYAKHIGTHVFEYKTTKPLHLLDMSRVDNVRFLISRALNNPDLLGSLGKSFAVSDNGTMVLRSSKKHHDLVVSEFVCSLGYDGYYAPRLKYRKFATGTFHQEIVLCAASNKIKETRNYTTIPFGSRSPATPRSPWNRNGSATPRSPWNRNGSASPNHSSRFGFTLRKINFNN